MTAVEITRNHKRRFCRVGTYAGPNHYANIVECRWCGVERYALDDRGVKVGYNRRSFLSKPMTRLKTRHATTVLGSIYYDVNNTELS